MKLLSSGDSNAKTKKNLRETVILYLSPSTQNDKGINLCPKASAGCLTSCLYTAGMGAFSNVQSARRNKANYYVNDRFNFIMQLRLEVIKKARKTDGELAVRLNGTSDIKLVEQIASTDVPSNVVFYDYTKILQKAGSRVLPSGHRYVVTFSRSETNHEEAMEHLADGGIVAMVFDEMPTHFNGYEVYDGDSRDDLMLDIKGGILGLKAKGQAKKDTTGFVVRADQEEKDMFHAINKGLGL